MVNENPLRGKGDLEKRREAQRVTPEFLSNVNEQVLETIDLADLLAHFVSWLLSRDHRSRKAKHLQGVLQIALAEFRREEKAEAIAAR